jgi:hypothetical protein
VLCSLTLDQADWAVVELGAHRYASGTLPTRRFFVYGYAGQGLWLSLGYQVEPLVEIRLPYNDQPAALPHTMSLDAILQDRRLASELHGLPPWDAAWLDATFGLALRPLPENWHIPGDPAAYQAILDEKARWAKARQP